MILVDSPFSSSSSYFEGDSFDSHSFRKITFMLLELRLIEIVFPSERTGEGLQKHALSSSKLSNEPSCQSVIHYFRSKQYSIPEAIYSGLLQHRYRQVASQLSAN